MSGTDSSRVDAGGIAEPMSRRALLARAGGVAVTASLGSTLLAACGSGSSGNGGGGGAASTTAKVAPFDASKVGGKVAFMGFQGYDDRTAIGAWMKQNGVTLSHTYVGANDDFPSKMRAGGKGSMDLLTPTNGYDDAFAQIGILQPMPLDGLPNFDRMLPEFQRVARDAAPAPDGAVYAVPLVWGREELIFDTTAVPRGFGGDWFDVLEAKSLKGKVSLIDDPYINIGVWAKAYGYPTDTMTKDQLARIKDTLLQIKPLTRSIAPTFGDQADQFARGEVQITPGSWSGIIALAQQKGAKSLFISAPKQGNPAWADTCTVAADAPNRDTTIALINQMLSKEAQTAYVPVTLSGIVNGDATQSLPASLAKNYPYRDVETALGGATFLVLPPLTGAPKVDNGVTYADWVNAWNEVKGA
jgi:spermidine/putrescine-binding protein